MSYEDDQCQNCGADNPTIDIPGELFVCSDNCYDALAELDHEVRYAPY